MSHGKPSAFRRSARCWSVKMMMMFGLFLLISDTSLRVDRDSCDSELAKTRLSCYVLQLLTNTCATMKIKTQFSSSANSYENYSIIQSRAIDKLLAEIDHSPARILDLGCGTGRLFKAVNWPIESFVAVDFSEEMLAEHPQTEAVTCIEGDFDDPALFAQLADYSIDRVFAASSLQWATDMHATFSWIKELGAPVSLAIFTADTFREIFKTAGIPPLLRTADEVAGLADEVFDARHEVIHYTLDFDNTLEMLRYIKRSGVSGARNILDYRATKRLIEEYPLDHLEFEVLYIMEP